MMRIFLLVLVIALSGCSASDSSTPADDPAGDGGANNGGAGNNGDDAAPDGLTYYRDIQPLLEAHCNECHSDGGIAPFTFATLEDVRIHGPAIAASVESGSMPPWLPDADCTDYANERRLNAEQRDAIVQWAQGDMAEGDPNAAPRDWELPEPVPFRADLTLTIPAPYTPQNAPDDYRCFLLDWPETETTYVGGFRVNPDNTGIVHHVIAYMVPPDKVAEYEALDAAAEGPGYTCYGGPGGDIQGAGDFQWLGGWAPGNPGTQGDGSNGIRVPPGSKVALQMHYNTFNGAGPDQSSVDFRIEREVDKPAWTIPFTNPRWLSGSGMEIPAGDESVDHSFEADITNFLSFLSEGAIADGAFVIHSVSLHMHQLGKRGRVSVLRADGTEDCLVNIPAWDFDWQQPYVLAEPVVVNPGDSLFLTCNWDNSQANQPYVNVDTNSDGVMDDYQQIEPRDVHWGDGSYDEMCLGIVYVTGE